MFVSHGRGEIKPNICFVSNEKMLTSDFCQRICVVADGDYLDCGANNKQNMTISQLFSLKQNIK